MRGLCLGGWAQTIADVQQEFEFLTQLTPDIIYDVWDTFSPSSLFGVDFTVAYSYGQADLWHMLASFNPLTTPAIKKHFIIVGVPRLGWGQTYWGKLWTIPSCIQRAKAFNLKGLINFPACLPISNPSLNCVNVDCDGRGLDHDTIVQDSQVKAEIYNDLLALKNSGIII